MLDDKKKIFLLVAGALVGIFVGVLLVIFARPSIILFTAVSGGFSVSSGLFGLLHWETPLYLFLAGICLTVCGMGIQWKTTKFLKNNKKEKFGHRRDIFFRYNEGKDLEVRV